MDKEFFIDNQTTTDLQIFDLLNPDQSLFAFFDHTTTIGGRARLKEFFKYPFSDIDKLRERTDNIKFFYDSSIKITFDRQSVDFIEFYLNKSDKPLHFSHYKAYKNAIRNRLSPDHDYYTKRRGVSEVYSLMKLLKGFCEQVDLNNTIELVKKLEELVDTVLNEFKKKETKGFQRLIRIEREDFFIHKTHFLKIKSILKIVYEIDALQAAAISSQRNRLSFPIYISSAEHKIDLEDLFHPFLNSPVSNNINFEVSKNVCIITGANMSGKSTLIKAMGISVFLAHIGFPVPAKKMETSVFDGLLTTINLADNLAQGYSHFYSEVLRLKFVAQKLKEKKALFVIFDELFRGTNVKDAYDSSLLIINVFSKIPNSFFVISTHIVEVANELINNRNICFKFFETNNNHSKPHFTYRLLEGITGERLGTWILQNEGVVDLLLESARNDIKP